MEFLEGLRQQQEAGIHVRSQQEVELQRKREAEETARLQREVQERERHQQCRIQAEEFRQESGVGTLVRTLGEILAGEKFLDHTISNGPHNREVFRSRGKSIGPDYVQDWLVSPFKKPAISLTDPDSTLDITIWDIRYVGEQEYDGHWSQGRSKFLAVETRPDGNVVFHSEGRETIQEHTWRTNPTILEEGLERAFSKPGTNEYKLERSIRTARISTGKPWE